MTLSTDYASVKLPLQGKLFSSTFAPSSNMTKSEDISEIRCFVHSPTQSFSLFFSRCSCEIVQIFNKSLYKILCNFDICFLWMLILLNCFWTDYRLSWTTIWQSIVFFCVLLVSSVSRSLVRSLAHCKLRMLGEYEISLNFEWNGWIMHICMIFSTLEYYCIMSWVLIPWFACKFLVDFTVRLWFVSHFSVIVGCNGNDDDDDDERSMDCAAHKKL